MDFYIELDEKSKHRFLTGGAGQVLMFIEDNGLKENVKYIWMVDRDRNKISFKEYNGFWENIDHKPNKLKHFVMASMGAVNIKDVR